MSADTATDNTKWFALALLAMTQFVIILDASIVNVALPSIGTDLQLSQDDLSWVVNAYTLTFGGFLLLGGRLADLLGRRRMFISGLILFGLASLAGGLAPEEWQLIAARAFQGLGAAIISPAALSIVTTTFTEGKERNTALGVWGAVAGAGGAAGVLHGRRADRVPGLGVGAVGERADRAGGRLAGAAPAGGEPRRDRDELRRARRRVGDLRPGGAGLRAGGRRVGGLGLDPDAGADRPWRWCCWPRSSSIESRTSHPLMPFSIFRLRTLRGANMAGLLVGMSLFSMFFFISLYLQQVLGYEPLKAGLAYLPLSVLIIISAGVGSNLVTRVGFKPTLIDRACCSRPAACSGSARCRRPAAATSATCCSRRCWPPSASGCRSCPVTIAAVTGTKPAEAGLASGLINTSQQIGGALGLAITATVATSTTTSAFEGGERVQTVALTEGFQAAFLTCAGLALAGALLAAVLISSRDSREHAEAARRGEVEPVAA